MMSTARVSVACFFCMTATLPAWAEQPRAISAATATTISAQDDAGALGFIVYGGGAIELSHGEYGAGSGSSISFEAYIEAELKGFYAGVWVQKTDEKSDDEVDVYLGYRKDLDSGFAYDLGYTRFFYPNDGGNCCGEVALTVSVPVGDKIGLNLNIAYDPDSQLANGDLEGKYYLSDKWTVSAKYGISQVEDDVNQREWEFGATYDLSDTTALDLRWYEGSDYPGYAALYLSFDTTLLER